MNVRSTAPRSMSRKRPAEPSGGVTAWRYSMPFAVLVAWLMCLSLLGGTAWADSPTLIVLHPLSVLVLAYGFAGLSAVQIGRHRVLLCLAAAWLALPLLQLVPLPPAVWQALPGRQVVADIDAATGLHGIWRPLSLAPYATATAAWALLVPMSVLVLGMRLDEAERRRLVGVVIILGFLSAFVALLQMAGGEQSPFYFFRRSDRGYAIGLFANHNHHATLLACLLLLLASWRIPQKAYGLRLPARWIDRAPFVAGAVVIVPLILLTGSRSGLIACLAAIALSPLLWRADRKAPARIVDWLPIAMIAIVPLLTIIAGRALSLDRLYGLSASEDMRARMLPTVLEMIRTYMPWGTGLGSFDPVFRMHEPDALLSQRFRNHAHNDWLELALTGGAPGVLLLLACLAACLWQGARIFRNAPSQPDVARLGLAILAILGLSSITDYPLRTPALAGLGALAALWVFSFQTGPMPKTPAAGI